jgi:hypothetical protein
MVHEFDDTMKTVSLSIMPDYIPKQLQRFFPGQVVPGSPVPAVYITPKYGKTGQQPVVEDETDPLSADELTLLQEILGALLLFYARVVDYTMVPAINHVSSMVTRLTKDALQRAYRILQYAAAYPAHKLV